MANADVVCGPNMWRMLEPLTKYFDTMVKGARATAYPAKQKG